MNDALYIAATGMKAQTAQLDLIANNVANMDTPGYKRGSLRFGDLISGEAIRTLGGTGANSPTANSTLAGVKSVGLLRSFAVGVLRRSDDPLSLAIQGEGFIEVQLPDGSAAFSRGGRLEVNSERLLATADGLELRQRIQVPADVRQIAIAEDGQVQGRDDAGRSFSLGRIDVAMFSNPSGLTSIGDGLWRDSTASGDALVMPAGEAGAGRLKQGFVESSNVQLVDEMVLLMVAQRAYEMNVKVMQTADEIASMTNNLRK
ncbi:flagellar hook-basal body protein [Roseateles microcysteis]|uniref:flagellar hook-basal body protein n=1 Tax=Roseateles microcysteis TaxID=3119057 RepID=UPI002FE5D4BC